MSNIKNVHGKPGLHVYQPIIWSMAAMLRDSTVVVVRTRPRAIPLSMITMRKSIHGFLFPYMLMGLRLAALGAAGAPLLFGVWPPCCATPSPAVVRTRPRAIPLPMTTMRKSVHGFHFPYMVMGLRLAAAGAPLSSVVNKYTTRHCQLQKSLP